MKDEELEAKVRDVVNQGIDDISGMRGDATGLIAIVFTEDRINIIQGGMLDVGGAVIELEKIKTRLINRT